MALYGTSMYTVVVVTGQDDVDEFIQKVGDQKGEGWRLYTSGEPCLEHELILTEGWIGLGAGIDLRS